MTNRSILDQICDAYDRALSRYCDTDDPIRYEIEILELEMQYAYKCINGQCSLQTTLDFDLEQWAISFINQVRTYLNKLRKVKQNV